MDQQVEVGDGQQEQSELHVNAPDEIWDQRFKATETGIYVHSEKGEGEWKKVCSPLYVAAEGRDANGKGWGLLVELPDACLLYTSDAADDAMNV